MIPTAFFLRCYVRLDALLFLFCEVTWCDVSGLYVLSEYKTFKVSDLTKIASVLFHSFSIRSITLLIHYTTLHCVRFLFESFNTNSRVAKTRYFFGNK